MGSMGSGMFDGMWKAILFALLFCIGLGALIGWLIWG